MHRLVRAVLVTAAVGLLAMGCSTDRNEGVIDNPNGLSSALFSLPDGAVITSATFYIYCAQTSNQPVSLHRITADWDEATVTWNSFAGAFDANVEGSFQADNLGWLSADVTPIVQEWAAGTYDNFGLLMKQPLVYYAMATYHSRENVAMLPPYLEICYDFEGSNYCTQINATADAYIREYYPDIAWGTADFLATGWGAPEYLEKQSLVRFDFESTPPHNTYGCTKTIGYWKTHAGFGPQANVVSQYLPIWLGDAGGAKSINVTDSAIAVDLLSQHVYCDPSNGITKLYAQLLGAKLNFAAGADPDAVASIVTDADAFLATHNCDDWDSMTKKEKQPVRKWHDKLDRYNNGLIGPGHCDDDIWFGQ